MNFRTFIENWENINLNNYHTLSIVGDWVEESPTPTRLKQFLAIVEKILDGLKKEWGKTESHHNLLSYSYTTYKSGSHSLSSLWMDVSSAAYQLSQSNLDQKTVFDKLINGFRYFVKDFSQLTSNYTRSTLPKLMAQTEIIHETHKAVMEVLSFLVKELERIQNAI